MDESSDVFDNFREVFKNFKRKTPLPDFSEVLDVRRLSEGKNFTELKRFPVVAPDVECVPGLQPIESWQAFSFPDHPGFIFILNPFLPSYESIWAERCLRDYARKPNHCNLDAHEMLTPTDDVWQTCVRNPSERASLLKKLRWVTLGYHHNWDTKVYSFNDRSPFPFDLCQLTRYVASAVGFPSYSPEAAIVNFYPIGSTLGGHTDHSEPDHQSPIFSFSFGCTAVFLLGGATKCVKPIPMFIRSGDIVVMFGPGRLNYHGVARIMLDPFSQSDVSCCQPLHLESCASKPNNDASSSNDALSASCDPEDALSVAKNCVLREQPRDIHVSLAFSDDLRRSPPHSSTSNRLQAESTGAEEDDKEEEERRRGGNNLEKDLSDSSQVAADLVAEYLSRARININVRQVFESSASSSSSAPSFSISSSFSAPSSSPSSVSSTSSSVSSTGL